MSIGYGIAFLAGAATFFATCLIPVLPVYIGYLGGLGVLQEGGVDKEIRRTVSTHSIVFVIGFLLVFATLGFAATQLGIFFASYRSLFQKVGGALIILFGIGLADIVRLPFLSGTYRLFTPSPQRRGSYLGALLFGLTFGFAWTPCIGPTLATILFLVTLSDSSVYGITLLTTFALGLGLPFIVLALFFQTLLPLLQRLQRATKYVQPLVGIFMIVVGILLMTDMLSVLSKWSLGWGGALLL